MATFSITNLTRCPGGNHYTATVLVDGRESATVRFAKTELEVESVDLDTAVKRAIAPDLNALWETEPTLGRRTTIDEERAAVVGKSGTTNGTVAEVRLEGR